MKGIQQWAERLQKAGITLRTKVFRDDNFKETSFLFEDCEGNILQFVEPY